MDGRAWLPPPRTPPPALRLLAIPFAGGGVGIYRSWQTAMPSGVEVLPVALPGRERRMAETPYTRMEPLIHDLWRGVRHRLADGPWAIFGHSMGAGVAYELARRGQAEGHPPTHLFVSARRAPGTPPLHAPLFALPDDLLLAETERLYGALPEVFRRHPGLLRTFLPTMRADFQLLDTWKAPTDAVLSCPVTAYAGLQDPAHPPHSVAGWSAVTSGAFRQVDFGGGHFAYVRDRHDARDDVAQTLRVPQR